MCVRYGKMSGSLMLPMFPVVKTTYPLICQIIIIITQKMGKSYIFIILKGNLKSCVIVIFIR